MIIPSDLAGIFSSWSELFNFDPTTGQHIQHWSGVALGTCAAYVLYHPATGNYYVGSSDDLGFRLSNHRKQLLEGRHFNAGLRQCFQIDRRFQFMYAVASDREHAYDLEQKLLDANQNDPFKLNTNSNARLHGLGRKPTEDNLAKLKASQKTDEWVRKNHAVTKSPEHSARVAAMFSKAVVIEGKEYASASAACRALGIHENTVRARLKSSNPAFKDWSWK